jgi:DNA-binding MarR family transcriptional regulator
MIKRVSQGDDRRIRCLQLTPHGKRIMRVRENDRVHRVSVVLRHLPAKARKEVLGTLQRLTLACVAARERDGHSE